MLRRLPTLILAVTTLGLAAAACGGSGDNIPVSSGDTAGTNAKGPAPAAVVVLKYVSFDPSHVTIHAGQTVEWKFQDSPVAHNITFEGFGSTTQASGTYFHTFDTPGTYPYRCTIHATMTGVVTVLP
ncbi:MAG: cupredoxin domain-containing protein [Acidimicrobiales bacterium]